MVRGSAEVSEGFGDVERDVGSSFPLRRAPGFWARASATRTGPALGGVGIAESRPAS